MALPVATAVMQRFVVRNFHLHARYLRDLASIQSDHAG
jgi:hypothetical protein